MDRDVWKAAAGLGQGGALGLMAHLHSPTPKRSHLPWPSRLSRLMFRITILPLLRIASRERACRTR
jgi:hypothetical protein